MKWGCARTIRQAAAGASEGRRRSSPAPVSAFAATSSPPSPTAARCDFVSFEGRFNARVFIDFIRRLRGSTSQKVFLIVDRHPVHLSKAVKAWLEQHTEQIRLFLLPTYSPEYNPGEFLNQDVKAHSVGRRRARNKREFMANVRGYLRSAQQRPHQVKRYFLAESVRYAAA